MSVLVAAWKYRITFNPPAADAGVYFVRAIAGARRAVTRFVLLP